MLLPAPAPAAAAAAAGAGAAEPPFAEWFRQRHGHAPGGAGAAGGPGGGAGGGHRLSRDLVELIILLLRVNPFERPLSAADVLRHRWFAAAE
jgi:hypothetical protein